VRFISRLPLIISDLIKSKILFMKKNTGTIFKVNFVEKNKHPKGQEGFVQLWKHKGKLQNGKQIPFNFPDELPRKMRHILKAAKITL
jgi:hypothetical protein